MKVLLLSAGRSKRMKPVEDKNFLMFLGKPLIQWQIEMLARNGFDEVVIVGGDHNIERLEEVASNVGINIEIVEQEDLEMGMCGAVLSAKDKIGSEPVLIFSSNDVVEDSAFHLLHQAIEEGAAESYILGKRVDEYFPGGYLEVDNGGYIQGIVEKPEPGTEPSDLVNLVVHYHSKPDLLIEALESSSSEKDDLYEVALDKLIHDGVKMRAVSYDGFWQPIKFPWHVQKVFMHLFEKNFSENSIPDSAQIADSAVLKGDIIIGENVRVFEGAIVNGPVYIGDNSIIANNALVRESNIGRDCVIGFSTEVARSFLGHDVWTHSNYVGDSVIGNNVSFGAGTITGNLRLDEKNICVECDGNKVDCGESKFGLVTGDNVRVGINTSFMPGIKVGKDSFIGAGIVVAENIPDKSFVRATFELKISENNATADASSRDDIKNKLKK